MDLQGMDLPLDLEALRRTLRSPGVVFALLFGSHAEGRAHEGADVDLAVWSDAALDDWRLRGELGDRVDLVDLHRTPEGLAGRVALEQDRDELLGDRVRLGDMKYTFQTAIEACIDAAQHVVADQGLGVPASNADAFRLLGDAGLLDPDLATSLAGAVGVRNVLVHDYAEVDDTRVVANLQRLGDLRPFVGAMTPLLDA